MDKINTSGHSGGKTNAIVGAVDIVVHGFGNSHRREAFFMETLPVTEGVISANGNQYIDAQVLQVAEDMRGKIVEFVLFCLPFKEFRYVLVFDFPRICSRGVEMGASGAIYGANPCSVQFYNIFLSTLGVVGVELEETCPTSSDSYYIEALLDTAVNHCFDTWVQPGHVATARKYPYSQRLLRCHNFSPFKRLQ